MEKEVLKEKRSKLIDDILSLGFNGESVRSIQEQLAGLSGTGSSFVTVMEQHLEGKVRYTLLLFEDQQQEKRVAGMDVALRKEIILPEIPGIMSFVNHLDKEMGKLDWSVNVREPVSGEQKEHQEEYGDFLEKILKIHTDLQLLNGILKPQGPEAARMLMLKHWLDTPHERLIPNAADFKENFEFRHFFSKDDSLWPSIQQARRLLDGKAVGKEIQLPGNPIQIEWFRLNTNRARLSDPYVIEMVGRFDLKEAVKQVPLSRLDMPQDPRILYHQLIQGERPAAFVDLDSPKQLIYLWPNPSAGAIELRTLLGEKITDTVSIHQKNGIPTGAYLSIIKKSTAMKNEEFSELSLDYNVARIKSMGLPDVLNGELADRMKKGDAQIQLDYFSGGRQGNSKATMIIDRVRGAYWPNQLHVVLQRPGTKVPREAIFQIPNFKGHGHNYDVPLPMALNLLTGNWVLNNWLMPMGPAVKEWRQYDFNNPVDGGYAFHSRAAEALDVANRMRVLPIVESGVENDKHKWVVLSLQRGNAQVVHLENSGNPTILLLADPSKADLLVLRKGNIVTAAQFKTEIETWQREGAALGQQPWRRPEGSGRLDQNDEPLIPVVGYPEVIERGLFARTTYRQPLLEGGSEGPGASVGRPGQSGSTDRSKNVLARIPVQSVPGNPGKQELGGGIKH